MRSHSPSSQFRASVVLLVLAGCGGTAPRLDVPVPPRKEPAASSTRPVEHVEQVSVCDDTGHAESGTADQMCCKRVASPMPLAREVRLDRDVHLRIAHGERACAFPNDTTPVIREQSLSPSDPVRPPNPVVEISWP